jgi:hypothetical protein
MKLLSSSAVTRKRYLMTARNRVATSYVRPLFHAPRVILDPLLGARLQTGSPPTSR